MESLLHCCFTSNIPVSRKLSTGTSYELILKGEMKAFCITSSFSPDLKGMFLICHVARKKKKKERKFIKMDTFFGIQYSSFAINQGGHFLSFLKCSFL